MRIDDGEACILARSGDSKRTRSIPAFATDTKTNRLPSGLCSCAQCGSLQAALISVRGLRLGRHKRQLLQLAPGRNVDRFFEINADMSDSAVQAARRRAVGQLRRSGLIDIQLVAGGGTRRLAIRRTIIGDAVMAAWGARAGGQGMRWSRAMDFIERHCRSSMQPPSAVATKRRP